jgi:hypothetical protein
MRIKGSFARGLFFLLAVTLIPTAAVSAQKVTPGSICKVYKQKVTYQNKVYSCIKSGKKLIWNKGIALKPKPTPTPTPSPIPTPTPTPTPKPTPTQEVAYPGVLDIERNLYLKMDAIVKEWTPYLSALDNNKVKVISENPSHLRNEENRLSAEVSFEILGKMLPRMVSPTYYMYETADWADKQMAATCPSLVGQNPAGTSSGAQVGCGKLVISNLNGWMNNIAGIDGSWFESAHETFHIAEFVAALVGTDPNNSLFYPYHPSWYREGSASTFGGLVRSLMSKGKYNYGDLNRFEKSPVSYSDCNKAWTYWQQTNNATGFSELGQCEYGLGRRMTDYLVAWHGGVEAILKNYQYVAQGKTFEEAFKLAHGIALKDFFVEVKPFLANQGFVIP